MSVPIPLRGDFGAARLRGLAKKTKDAAQARRLLALAAIYDGATRTEAARIGGVGLQIIREQHHLPARATESVRAPISCTSTENADSSSLSLRFVRVTHPFHPLFGRRIPCVGKRYNRYGKRLLLQMDDGTVWSVPPQWTDLAGLDPAVVMGDGQAFLRAVDLMELASLVKRLSDKSAARQSSKM